MKKADLNFNQRKRKDFLKLQKRITFGLEKKTKSQTVKEDKHFSTNFPASLFLSLLYKTQSFEVFFKRALFDIM
jgi:hypothetical protein